MIVWGGVAVASGCKDILMPRVNQLMNRTGNRKIRPESCMKIDITLKMHLDSNALCKCQK